VTGAGLNIDIRQLLAPAMIASVLKGEEFDITPLIDLYVQDMIVKNVLATIKLPKEFEDLHEIVNLMLQVQQFKTLSAILRGEKPELDIGKIIDLVVSINLVASLATAFEGGGAK